MKRNQINPIQLINEHCSTLREHLSRTHDPNEKRLLQKRLRNLYNVREFLASFHENDKLDPIGTWRRTA